MLTIEERRERKRFYRKAHQAQRSEYNRAWKQANPEKAKIASKRQREHLQAKQAPAICMGCGKTFIPKASDRRKYCSRECCFEYKRAHPKSKNSGLNPIIIHINVCKICGKTFVAKRKKTICSDECRLIRNRNHSLASSQRYDKRNRAPRKCKECGKSFVPEYGDKRRNFCSAKCSRKSYLKSPQGKAQRKKHNARRRAAARGVITEMVDIFKVMQRDRWQCQLCGIKTLKNKRGTCDDRAPELDHIVPLALGGSHMWHNVQCACRKCNIEKGAKARGQLRLAI